MASVKEFVYCLIISPPFGSDLQPAQRIAPNVADREQASSKVWSTRPPSFIASWHRYIVSTRVLNIKNLVLSAYIRDVGTEKGGEMKDYKEFKSIHVDLEKGIYLLNGEPMKYVTEMNLMLDGERWSLGINKYEWFKESSRRYPSSIARAIRDTGASIRGQE